MVGNQPRFQDSLLLVPPGKEVGESLRFSVSSYHLDYKLRVCIIANTL